MQQVCPEKQYINTMTSLKRLLINHLAIQDTQHSICDCLIAFCECLQNRPIPSLLIGDIVNELVSMYTMNCKNAMVE